MSSLLWYDRLYLWTRSKMDVRGTDLHETDTCKWIRTLFLYFPLVCFMYVVQYVFIPVGVVGLIGMVGYAMYTMELMELLYHLGVIAATMAGILLGVTLIFVSAKAIASRDIPDLTPRWPEWLKLRGRFWETLQKSYQDWHDRVCTKFRIGETP